MSENSVSVETWTKWLVVVSRRDSSKLDAKGGCEVIRFAGSERTAS